MRAAFSAALAAMLCATSAGAEQFDWRDTSARQQMAGAFENMASACVNGFGFTRIPPLPRATMVSKLDAYLLLRDDADADAQVQDWAEQVIEPVNAMVAKKSTGLNAEDEHRAAAAAVAAAEDPSSYADAEARYMDGAMASFQRGLDACTVGARDPFLGKYYWTGTGSIADYEREMRAYFATLVSQLREPRKPVRRK